VLRRGAAAKGFSTSDPDSRVFFFLCSISLFTDSRVEEQRARVRWNHVSDHALTVLGIAHPELYINPLILHYFIYFRQLLI